MIEQRGHFAVAQASANEGMFSAELAGFTVVDGQNIYHCQQLTFQPGKAMSIQKFIGAITAINWGAASFAGSRLLHSQEARIAEHQELAALIAQHRKHYGFKIAQYIQVVTSVSRVFISMWYFPLRKRDFYVTISTPSSYLRFSLVFFFGKIIASDGDLVNRTDKLLARIRQQNRAPLAGQSVFSRRVFRWRHRPWTRQQLMT